MTNKNHVCVAVFHIFTTLEQVVHGSLEESLTLAIKLSA